MRITAIAAVFVTAILGAVLAVDAPSTGDPLWDLAHVYLDPLPNHAPSAENPPNEAKIELGRALYFDKRLSRSETVSCDSCHSLARFGVDRLPTSPGDEGQLGERNSPTVLNAALHASQFWDGRAPDVEQQAGMPVLNPVEMAIPSEQFLLDRLAQVPEYRQMFERAFAGESPALTYANIRLAIAAFERTLLTPAPLDDYLLGDTSALDRTERAGLATFLDLGCASCHNGVNLGAGSFRKFGLNGQYWLQTHSTRVDDGRFKLTGDEEDRYVFRVASLRNVAETAPYFHDGSVAALEEAVRVMVKLQVGVEPEPRQVAALVAFLETLTGTLPPEVACTAVAPAFVR